MRNVRFFSPHDLPCTVEMISDEFFAAWQRSEETCDAFGRSVKLGDSISAL